MAVLEWFTATNVLLGAGAFCFSTYAALMMWFARNNIRSKLSFEFGMAICGMFAAEAILLGGTMVFTMAAHYGLDVGWTELTRSLIRTPMLLAAFVTSIHLVKVIRRLCGF